MRVGRVDAGGRSGEPGLQDCGLVFTDSLNLRQERFRNGCGLVFQECDTLTTKEEPREGHKDQQDQGREEQGQFGIDGPIPRSAGHAGFGWEGRPRRF